MYLVKTPFWLRWLYPQLTWRQPASEKTIYLTFDDGPIPEVTPFVLDLLNEYRAKASFFCIGDNVRKHPDIFDRIIAEGHSVGNHTYNHLNGWNTVDEVYIDNFRKCDMLVNSHLFRPPYGRIKRSQVKKLRLEFPELDIIMWDVLSGDFDLKLSPEKCLRRTIESTCSGSIVVFHDSLKAFRVLTDVLPKALEFWKMKGYKFEVL